MDKPHCLKLHNSAKKTIQYNARLKSQLLENSTKLYLPNPETKLHEQVVVTEFDPMPIIRVSERIIRGLYFKHFGQPLVSHAKCHVWLSDMITPENKSYLLGLIEDMKISGTLVSVGANDEFAYLYSGTECKFSTAWMLTFNKETYIFGLTEKQPQPEHPPYRFAQGDA